MKETTLEHVVNSLKDSFLKGKPAFSFAHPFSDVCFKVLSSSENVCIYSTTSITVLNKDALLAELLKITGIDKHEQTEENKITLQSVRDEISDGLFHRFWFVFNTIGMPLNDMSILRNLENAKVSMISGEKMSIETKDNVKVLDEIDKALNDRKGVTDPINPTHYNGTQTLDRMVAVFGVDAVISFCEINAFKYRMRAGKKDGNPIEQDIKKALWYEGKASELKRKDNDG